MSVDEIIDRERKRAFGFTDDRRCLLTYGDFRRLLMEIEAAAKRERDDMLDVLVRIGNWCAQDLAENAYVSEPSGNYLKTLNGLCEVGRPYMKEASRLKRYGGTE